MKIAIPRERRPLERRVAASPETVRRYRTMGFEVQVETGAGLGSAIADDAFAAAGAAIAADAGSVHAGAGLVLKVRRPVGPGAEVPGEPDEVAMLAEGATLICLMEPHRDRPLIEAVAGRGVTCFAMDLVPRISRAQSMDVLTSQANLAGYRAVIEAAHAFGRAFPMMMTAAGTVPPARCMVMGAGVAGLQAIATARRLGAVVSATDVRPAVKEQVQSLGASFVAVEDEEFRAAETEAGYAKPMSAAYHRKQAALVAETLGRQDIVICAALVAGRTAPVLIDEAMVRAMKPGSVIVDLAIEQGGNCALSEFDAEVERHGVRIIAPGNMAARIAVDASALYARNLWHFLTPMAGDGNGALTIDREDEIIRATMLTGGGRVLDPAAAAPGAGG